MRLRRGVHRTRGYGLAEVAVAVSLAVVLIGVHAAELHRQRRELGAAAREQRARKALLSSYERLRVGSLAAPSEGQTLELEGSSGLTVSVSRAEAPSGQELGPGLVSLTLRVDWVDEDGGPRWRELSALAPEGGEL